MADGTLSEKITQDVRSYVDMRVDAARLSVVEGLSSVVGNAVSMVLALFLVNLAMMLLTAAAVYGISLMINSLVWAVIIMALVYLLLALLLVLRPGFFVDRMVGVFSKLIFHRDRDDDEDDD